MSFDYQEITAFTTEYSDYWEMLTFDNIYASVKPLLVRVPENS